MAGLSGKSNLYDEAPCQIGKEPVHFQVFEGITYHGDEKRSMPMKYEKRLTWKKGNISF